MNMHESCFENNSQFKFIIVKHVWFELVALMIYVDDRINPPSAYGTKINIASTSSSTT